MNDHLLAYLLKLDDPEERRRTEAGLKDDPALREHLDRLRRALEPLESDREPPAPPADLAVRAIAHVAQHLCSSPDRVPLPAAMPAEELIASIPPERLRALATLADSGGPEPSRWRRADLVVAASLLIAALGTLFAGVPYIQYRRGVLACQDTLRQYHQALAVYSDMHNGRFPQVEEQNRANVFVPLLQAEGLLAPGVRVACPVAPAEAPPVGFAYSLGYRDEAGRLYGLRRDPQFPAMDTLPILADRPGPGGTSGLDHRGGQNVLFVGGNVRFCTNSRVGVGGDEIYLNQLGQIGAGVNLWDTALGAGESRP